MSILDSGHLPTFLLKQTPKNRDLFAVIKNESLLPSIVHDPANYAPLTPTLLDEPCNVGHICDFVVEYINSDVLVSWFHSCSVHPFTHAHTGPLISSPLDHCRRVR